MGAYVTGNEIIGIIPSGECPPVIAGFTLSII